MNSNENSFLSLDKAAQLMYEIPPPFGFRDMGT